MYQGLKTLLPWNVARALLALYRDVETHSGPGCKPKSQQIKEILSLCLRGGYYPQEYYDYHFYELGKDYLYMLRFLPQDSFKRQVRTAWNDNRWKCILDNKWLFHLYYKSMGLPVTSVLGYYHSDGGCTIAGQPLRNANDLENLLWQHRPTSLVIKPVGGIQGKGVLVIRSLQYNNSIAGARIDGEPVVFGDLTAHMDSSPDVSFSTPGYTLNLDGYLIEERLEDHPFFAEINPYTASTIRIVTYAHADGRIDVDFATVRFGRVGSQVENFSQGGLSVGIDRETGELGLGETKPKFGATHRCGTHPDSNVQFAGRVVPMWRQIVDVCKQAAALSPGVKSIGWDVILTPAGPRIIEGNPDWALAVQMHTEGYLTPYIRARLAQNGLRFPTNRLQGLQFRGFAALIRYR
jgi:hypothetical protein